MPKGKKLNLDTLADISVAISVEAGTKKVRLGTIKSLSQGSVIELDKPVGDLLDVKVNGKTIARGEIVVINNKLGVRLVELLSVDDKLKS